MVCLYLRNTRISCLQSCWYRLFKFFECAKFSCLCFINTAFWVFVMLLSHLQISVSNTVGVLVISSMCLCDNICCHSVWLSRLFSFLSSTRLTILRFVFLGTLCVAISYALQYKASYDHVAHFFLEKPSTSMFLYFHSFKIISAH
jgi:hypothetical protein